MTAAPFRLALIGAGRWGRAYLKTIPGVAGTLLTRVASGNPETRALVPPGCAVETDWRAAALAGDVDGVIVAAPPRVHADIALAALAGGKAVLIEKPLTLDAGQARRVLAAARRAGKAALVEHTMLFHPAYEELKIRARGLGALLSMSSAGSNWGPFRADTPALWDYAPHDVALCLDLAGGAPIKAVARRLESASLPEGLGENLKLTLEFPGGPRAEIFCGNMTRQKQRRFEAVFEKGTLLFDDLGSCALSLRQAAGPPRPLPVSAQPPLSRAVAAFAAAAAAAAPDFSSLELGVGVVETLTCCQASLAYLSNQ